MPDIVHTLGIDESEFVRGLKRSETQAMGFSKRFEAATPRLKAMHEGIQRAQALTIGMVGAFGAAVAAVDRLATGWEQYQRAGEFLDREREKFKQVTVEINARVTAEHQLTRAIEERYRTSLRELDDREENKNALRRGFYGVVNRVGGADPAIALRATIETERRNALAAMEAAKKNREDLEAEDLRRGLRRDVAGSAATIGEDRESARFRVEAIEHEERLARIRELTTLDKARIDELTKLENERHWRVVQSVSAETAERITKAATERAEQNRLAEERRAADEEAIARSLEDTRISNLRAAGKESEARQAEIIARFEQQRLAIERSTASEGFKRASLDKLTEERMSALALAGRPDDARLGTRGVGTGLGAQATRQALGAGPGRTIERATTTLVADVKRAVEILNKMAAATPLPVLG